MKGERESKRVITRKQFNDFESVDDGPLIWKPFKNDQKEIPRNKEIKEKRPRRDRRII